MSKTTHMHIDSFSHKSSVPQFEQHFGVKYGTKEAVSISRNKPWLKGRSPKPCSLKLKSGMEFLTVNTSHPLNDEDVKKFEKFVGTVLSSGVRAFYMKGNGGKLPDERCMYVSSDGREFDIKNFLPISYPRFDGDMTVEQAYEILVENKYLVPRDYIPIVIDGGGFPFCLRKGSEDVFFANMESGELIFIEKDLETFVTGVITEDEAWA